MTKSKIQEETVMSKGYLCPNQKCNGGHPGHTLHYDHHVGNSYYYKCSKCGTTVNESYPYDEDDVSDSDDES